MIWRSCLLFAVIGLFLQGSEAGHMLLVEHARCAEHGELVHGTDTHDHAAEVDQPADHHGIDRAPDSDEDSAHGHCSHASERRDAAVDVPSAEVLAVRSIELDVTLHHEVATATSAQLYRTAPKNSPPA